jgi:endonuclease/exonuclease/phosphatase family metal-dependent hydrolase
LNAHFSWVPVQARLNLVEALPFMSSFSGLALLVGDLNNTPDCEPMQMIREAGWTDVWAQLHPNKSGYTYESPKPTMRIDYAWANPRLAPAVRAIEMVAEDAAANGVQASDHLGLVITLDLDPSPARA